VSPQGESKVVCAIGPPYSLINDASGSVNERGSEASENNHLIAGETIGQSLGARGALGRTVSEEKKIEPRSQFEPPGVRHKLDLLFSLFNKVRMIEDFSDLVCRNDNGDSHVDCFCLAALLETDWKIPMIVDQPQKINWSGSRNGTRFPLAPGIVVLMVWRRQPRLAPSGGITTCAGGRDCS
jgi:hypothetical protein